MQPMSPALERAYRDVITSDHDFDVEARVLTMEETLVGHAVLLGGQVNFQRDALVRRTASFTLFDPDFSLALDSASPFEAALFADRMLQIRHTVDVPGFGETTVIPFVGPMVKLSRDGDSIAVECQDKSSLAIRGTRPFRAKKGRNAVAAIRAILRERTGETRFRFPEGTKRRLSRSYNVGWSDEASPWVVCQRIARQELGLQLLYSCDGYATLRRHPRSPVFVFDSEVNLTSLVDAEYDFSTAVNYARVEVGKVTVKRAELNSKQMMSKEALGRRIGDGTLVPRYLPVTESMSAPSKPDKPNRKADHQERHKYRTKEMPKYRKKLRNVSEKADARAGAIIEANRTLVGDFSWTATPVMHLDVDDLVAVRTSAGGVHLRLSEASIPVLVEGDMSCGRQQNLTQTKRRRQRRGR